MLLGQSFRLPILGGWIVMFSPGCPRGAQTKAVEGVSGPCLPPPVAGPPNEPLRRLNRLVTVAVEAAVTVLQLGLVDQPA